MSEVYICDVVEANDGSGDLLIKFPDELVEKAQLKENEVVDLSIEDGKLIIERKS